MDMRQESQLPMTRRQRCGEQYMWKQHEINYLIDNYQLPYNELAKHLNRTPKAIDHKLRTLGLPTQQQPKKPRVKYLYQRHTDECSGIDPIVIDRIVSAGTIEHFATKHPVCDCERAYILKYIPDAYRILLQPRPALQQRLNAIPV